MRKYFVWFLLILLIVVRYFTTRPVFKDGDNIRLTTVVYSDPVIYPTSQYLSLVNLKIYLPLTPQIDYGDNIVVEGEVQKGELKKPKIISVNKGGLLSGFRKSIIAFYNSALPEPEGGLMSGIVIGSKAILSADFYNRTKIAGVAHVVVASGTNITFVISFLTGILFVFLARKKAIFFVILGIILYLFISGFQPPLIRAAIMSSVLFLSQETGRIINRWNIFFLTVAIMLAINPDWVLDIGFQLSFASTASMMLFGQRLTTFLKRVPEFLRQDLATTLSAQIGTTPILFVVFGYISLWAPLTNLLVLWTIPPLMIIGAVGGVVGLIIPFFGKLILFLGYPLLWWFCHVVTVFS